MKMEAQERPVLGQSAKSCWKHFTTAQLRHCTLEMGPQQRLVSSHPRDFTCPRCVWLNPTALPCVQEGKHCPVGTSPSPRLCVGPLPALPSSSMWINPHLCFPLVHKSNATYQPHRGMIIIHNYLAEDTKEMQKTIRFSREPSLRTICIWASDEI